MTTAPTTLLSPSAVMRDDVPVIRLYVMRAAYLLVAIGMGIQVWPGIVSHGDVELSRSVVRAMLGALTALCLVGVRYPLKMLPMLFFEFAWKSIWLLSFALPLALAHRPMNPGFSDTVTACLLGVVVCPIAIPWVYVFRHYVTARGDRWR